MMNRIAAPGVHVDDFEEDLRQEEERLRAEAELARVWNESAFAPADPVIGQPQGAFARLVAEILPRVPRRMWRNGLVGVGPDGATRVTWGLGKRTDGDGGPGARIIRQRSRGTSKCDLFFVKSEPDYELDEGYGLFDDGYGLFVVLRDGRGSYAGSLGPLRRAAISVIASRELPAESLLNSGYAHIEWRTS